MNAEEQFNMLDTTATTKSAATAALLDHAHAARLLDRVYALAADLDHSLAVAGLRSWMGPRVHLLAASAELHHLRHSLDTLAGGPGQATPYVLRPVAALSAPAVDFRGPPWPRNTCGGR